MMMHKRSIWMIKHNVLYNCYTIAINNMLIIFG
jgi:hypothetical protein